MLFNSFEFLGVFLPATIAGFYLLRRTDPGRACLAWLVLASLFFYGWWNPAYLTLLGGSILFNYVLGRALGAGGVPQRVRLGLVTGGIVVNAVALGWFKYAGFLAANLSDLIGVGWRIDDVILPLAISFFTFQQIAYLVDAYRRQVKDSSLLSYCLFVSFFPQLIAGPIVHHREMMPQFAPHRAGLAPVSGFAIGVTFLTIGLFKKVVLADQLALIASPVFAAAEGGSPLGLVESWLAALSYTFQLYFDFSGYSDMAMGLAAMFGILLPLNFDSPYQATSIIDFWRRWHMTLSRFLKDYIYIPLGGNRRGPTRRYTNLMITMLIGGLWHGAGWTFVLWGGVHGLYMCMNHLWRRVRPVLVPAELPGARVYRVCAVGFTFLAVTMGWVIFRSASLGGATHLLAAMVGHSVRRAGGGGLAFPPELNDFALVVIAAMICFGLPNTYRLITRDSAMDDPLASTGRLVPWLAAACAVVLFCSMHTMATNPISEFIYFEF